MEISWSIPSSITDKIRPLIKKDAFVLKATRILREGKVSVSFSKGDMSGYLIHSGLVREDRAYECKVVYKQRLEGTDQPPLSSNCDCIEWTPEGHCHHTAALLLSYLLKSELETTETNDSSRPPINLTTSFGVSVEEYGTIIQGPHSFVGSATSPTYTSLQYLLHNRKVVNFPVPENFKGQLILKLYSEDKKPVWSYRAHSEASEESEVSLFENLYLFFWKSGEALHLNSDLKDFIQKIRINRYSLKLNDYLRLSQSPALKDHLEVFIDDKALAQIPIAKTHPRVMLTPGKTRSLVQFDLLFHDEQDFVITPPEILTAFAYQEGRLLQFKRKKDAMEFIGDLTRSFKEESEGYKRLIIGLKEKNEWLDLIAQMSSAEDVLLYDENRQTLASYETRFVRDLLTQMHDLFGELFFRYASYSPEEKMISYQISSSNLFQGLSAFNTYFLPQGLSIYYDRQEISKWSSRIRFERRQGTTQWFDLELNLTASDLDIVRQADLENGFALTNKGLVLLTPEQKDLVRFMKKYTQYEGQEVKTDINGEPIVDGEETTHRFTLPFNRARIFELFELKKMGIEGALTQEEIDLCERLTTLEKMPEYPIPEQSRVVMRPYQKVGYQWLRFLHENKLGACLADDMGLGKTLQAITFLQSQYDNVKKVLIVCPVSILLNWQYEFEKFSQMDIHIYHGGERALPDDAKIILTSYGVMKKEVDETFKDIHFDVVVLDEVQHLKNIRSLGAYAARKIQADFRICLTGTPVENDLSEFYNILDLCVPGVWGDLQFIRTTSTAKSRLTARKTASPFILRRTKGQVLTDLPDKIENNVFLSFNEQEDLAYKKKLLSIRSKIQNSPSKTKYGEILKGLLELRQHCLWQNSSSASTYTASGVESTKIEFLMETLEQILEEGHQAIVFSQFTTYLDIIQKIIQKKHWKLSRIDGSQSIKKRQEEVEKFQSSNTQVFLISLKAGGVGLNLTAASYVFLMDPWWNPAVEAQAIDRAHRIGQKNQLTVYRPIIKGSVEEKVLQLQEMKKQLFMDLLPENDDRYFTGKLTMRDFEDLFG